MKVRKLAKLDCKLRMSSMSWNVSSMSLISWTVSWICWIRLG